MCIVTFVIVTAASIVPFHSRCYTEQNLAPSSLTPIESLQTDDFVTKRGHILHPAFQRLNNSSFPSPKCRYVLNGGTICTPDFMPVQLTFEHNCYSARHALLHLLLFKFSFNAFEFIDSEAYVSISPYRALLLDIDKNRSFKLDCWEEEEEEEEGLLVFPQRKSLIPGPIPSSASVWPCLFQAKSYIAASHN